VGRGGDLKKSIKIVSSSYKICKNAVSTEFLDCPFTKKYRSGTDVTYVLYMMFSIKTEILDFKYLCDLTYFVL
jgi:hypothetical protein